MRTNIFITNNTVAADFVQDIASMTTDIALVKAKTNGTELEKQFNLAWVGGDSRYANLGNRETRLIPISLCELFVNETENKIAKYNDRYVKFELTISDDFDLTNIIGSDVTLRIILPVGFNHRNSWNFSYQVKNGSTIEDIKNSLYTQILASSIKEHIDIEHYTVSEDSEADDAGADYIKFYVTEDIPHVFIYPLDATISSWLTIEKVPEVNNLPSGFENKGVELVTRAYLRKLILDADANYGFDYINCPTGEFYPNQLRAREVDFILDTFTKVVEDVFGGTIGLTHITFVEPRIVETTGHVVKQVINIIHPMEDTGDFVYADYVAMIQKLTGEESESDNG